MHTACSDEGLSTSRFWRLVYRPDTVTSILYPIAVVFSICLRSLPKHQNFAEVHAGSSVLRAGADLHYVSIRHEHRDLKQADRLGPNDHLHLLLS
jgi:hypothetical protein